MVPPKDNSVWRIVVDSKTDYHLSELATKMFLTRVRLLTKNDPHKVAEAIDLAYEFFTKNEELLSNDIRKIFKMDSL